MTAPRLGLSPRQQQAFNNIVAFQATFGRTPNYKELATALGVRSKSVVSRLITALQERGYIARLPYRAYSIAVIDNDAKSYQLPASVEAALDAFCRLSGEKPEAVVADAVVLHLDELDPRMADDKARDAIGMCGPVELPS